MRALRRRRTPRSACPVLLWAAVSFGCSGGGGGTDGAGTSGTSGTSIAEDPTTTDAQGSSSGGSGSSTGSTGSTSGTSGGEPTGPADSSGVPGETTDADETTAGVSTGPVVPDCEPGRVEVDRPDDHAGAYQVHVDYVLPSDGVDEQLDLDGRIATSVASIEAWMAAQADGRRLRFDTCGGALDIRFVRLAKSEAALKAEGVYIRDAIELEMQTAGLISPTKLELVYYGGDADSTCGSGPYPPGLIGRVGALYLKGSFADPNIPSCASNPVGASLDQPGYFDFSALHEMFHALGLAPGCAPHHTLQGHVSDSPTDLMYAGAQPWAPAVLDLGRDDYLDHGNPNCPDLGRSVFVEPLPADPLPPPGW